MRIKRKQQQRERGRRNLSLGKNIKGKIPPRANSMGGTNAFRAGTLTSLSQPKMCSSGKKPRGERETSCTPGGTKRKRGSRIAGRKASPSSIGCKGVGKLLSRPVSSYKVGETQLAAKTGMQRKASQNWRGRTALRKHASKLPPWPDLSSFH